MVIRKISLQISNQSQFYFHDVCISIRGLFTRNLCTKGARGIQINSKNRFNFISISDARVLANEHWTQIDINGREGRESGWIESKYKQEESESTRTIVFVKMYTSEEGFNNASLLCHLILTPGLWFKFRSNSPPLRQTYRRWWSHWLTLCMSHQICMEYIAYIYNLYTCISMVMHVWRFTNTCPPNDIRHTRSKQFVLWIKTQLNRTFAKKDSISMLHPIGKFMRVELTLTQPGPSLHWWSQVQLSNLQ